MNIDQIIAGPDPVTAVSYTHLDVYKRQAIIWSIFMMQWSFRWCRWWYRKFVVGAERA